jgi:hypothetical protein
MRRVGGSYCRAYILPAVAVLRSSDQYSKEGAPESPGDHPGTDGPRDDGPYSIPDAFAKRLPERHAEWLTDRLAKRRPICLGDGFGERCSLSERY